VSVDLPSEITLISLCAGIGGLDLGVSLAAEYLGRTTRVACYVEIESYAAAVLAHRMEEGHIPAAPIWTDARTFPSVAHLFRGKVHGVLAGYPCQPFSAAGKRKGHADPRHLFPHIRRAVRAIEPLFCFFENVRGHLSLGFDVVLRSLQRDGYRVFPGIFSASECGASHRRERLFILAVADRFNGQFPESERGPSGGNGTRPAGAILDDPASARYHRGQSCAREQIWDAAWRSEPHGRCDALEHAIVSRWPTTRSGRQIHAGPEPESGSLRVANPSEPRLQECQQCGPHRERERERERANRNHCDQLPNFVMHRFRSFPMGRMTNEEWQRIIDQWPELAPAVADSDISGCGIQPGSRLSNGERTTYRHDLDGCNTAENGKEEAESEFRGLASGSTRELVERVRTDRLRADGNLAVPLTAAFAFLTLARKAGLIR
jgi:site-specific DNA-cytosine methylase